MARTIAVSEEVYKLLKNARLPEESFSKVIKRSLKRGKLSDIIGTKTLSRKDWNIAKRRLLKSEGLSRKKMLGYPDDIV